MQVPSYPSHTHPPPHPPCVMKDVFSTWRLNERCLFAMINRRKNMRTIAGGSADRLLCENLLSFAPAAIFFCQPVKIFLIANTAEDCLPALVQNCLVFKTHTSLPAVKTYLKYEKKKHSTRVSYSLGWTHVGLIVSHQSTWTRLHDHRDELECGWCVRGKLGARRVLSLSLRAFCQTRAKKKKLQSLSHDTWGGREEAALVGMMYGVDPSLRLGL